jgi:hypothetical protein
MNVHHPAVKIIRINYTTYGVSYSFVNMHNIKKEVLLNPLEIEKFRLYAKEKEKLNEKKNQ